MKIILETPRLILREFIEADAATLFELNNDSDVIRYTGDDPFANVEEAKSFLRQYDGYTKDGYGRWTVLLKTTNQYAGWCGLHYSANAKETDLGFRFMRKYWNKGFASEAAGSCIDFGFQRLGLVRIIGRTMKDNLASIRVLEKIGLVFEKTFEAHGGQCLQYYTTENKYEQ